MSSNDPRRKNHSGDPRKQGNDGAAAGPVSVPAFPGAQPVPNGHPAPTGQPARIAEALAPMFQQLPGQIAEALSQQQADQMAEAFYQVLSRVPVQLKLNCAECMLARQQWNARHEAELQAGFEAYQAALGELGPEDPRRGIISPVMFLPPHLQPSQDPANPNPDAIPSISSGDTIVNGTLVCASHDPRVPAQVARRPYLIANAHMSPTLLAEMARI